jgi:hypothetical protein
MRFQAQQVEQDLLVAMRLPPLGASSQDWEPQAASLWAAAALAYIHAGLLHLCTTPGYLRLLNRS